MCMHAVLIRLDLFPKRTEEHEGWEGDWFAWGWGSLSAVEGGAEDGYDPNTWHVWRTLSNIELSALPSLSESLERLSHIGSQQAPVSAPRAMGFRDVHGHVSLLQGDRASELRSLCLHTKHCYPVVYTPSPENECISVSFPSSYFIKQGLTLVLTGLALAV